MGPALDDAALLQEDDLVALARVASARASRTFFSVTASMAAVESSKIITPGPGTTPRAIDSLCR